jgi:homocysteine S-methyltransferase
MGTLLHRKGIPSDACFDRLNLEDAALVQSIHRDYLLAGAEMLQTNTFGANRYKLTRHGIGERLAEINAQGVFLARQALAETGLNAYVAGDVGPLGLRLAPYGRVRLEDAREAFKEQMKALVDAGADLLIIETMSDLNELVEAIAAAREVADDLPVIASASFTREDVTLLGDTPQEIARAARGAGADVIGMNCSAGPNQLLRVLDRMRGVFAEGLFSVMPNAGWPQQVGDRVMYAATPRYFGDYAVRYQEAGARIIGGCCGTTPEHVAAMRDALQAHKEQRPRSFSGVTATKTRPGTTGPESESGKGDVSALAGKLREGRFVINVEIDPPRGPSTYRLLAAAELMNTAGADCLDIADSPMAHMRMSPWAVCSLVHDRVGMETVLHFPTRGRNILRVQGDLLAAHALGIRNILAVMGDPTTTGGYSGVLDGYDVVPSGLVRLIKEKLNSGMDHQGESFGQATSFFVGCALNLAPFDLEKEMKNLRRKVEAGADFVVTEPIYEASVLQRFLDAYRQRFGELRVPVLVGLLPLASARHAAFLDQEVPGISIPEKVQEHMRHAGDQAAREGIRLAIDLAADLRDTANGIYLIPAFNHFDYAAEIIEGIRQAVPAEGRPRGA